MSNTIYIDANRKQCDQKTDENNEWTYKLNTELLLPKGTQVSVQNSFLNKKGITGGSIEIDEDIIESISYIHYITENPLITPVADYVSPLVPWFRSTLKCSDDTFRGNFSPPITGDGVNEIVYGRKPNQDAVSAGTNYNGTDKTPDFLSFGGCGQILYHCRFSRNNAYQPDGAGTAPEKQYFIQPQYQTLTLFIPKGVYGIGELGQLIEDQFNGIKSFDDQTRKLVNKSDTQIRAENWSNIENPDKFNGSPYNRPLMKQIDLCHRYYMTDSTIPENRFSVAYPAQPATDHRPVRAAVNSKGADCFINSFDFIKMRQDTMLVNDTLSNPVYNNEYNWFMMNGNPATDHLRAAAGFNVKPFYLCSVNFDTGQNETGADYTAAFGPNTGRNSIGHKTDDQATIQEYYLYDYDSMDMQQFRRVIGTTNFSFKYDSEKNGFSINGLHNQMRSPSHDRWGSKIESAGQPVINFKKIRRGGLADAQWVAPDAANREARSRTIGALNRPETRDMGIMILNFGRETAFRLGNNTHRLKNQLAAKFEDFFQTEKDAKKAWEETIWYRLGFDYEQLNEPQGSSVVYNKVVVPDEGFTTDTTFDNTTIPTISTLPNPVQFKPPNPDGSPAGKDQTTSVSGLQVFDTNTFATPWSYMTQTGSEQGTYANTIYSEAVQVPVIISDVGGVVAKRLPTLSNNPYFIITCDICDNYKDNVKKGDVLPILAQVPKSSLSNQDFIVGQSQIVQVLSQDKVINKIHIKVLNPDLTAPELEDNSSILLKIDVPNKTPLSLLQEDPNMKKIVQEIMAEQQQLVGN